MEQVVSDRQDPGCSLLPGGCTSKYSQSLVSTGKTDGTLLPLKSFVLEVFERSRMSGSIMQAALCYLEAVCPKIPEILRDEILGVFRARGCNPP